MPDRMTMILSHAGGREVRIEFHPVEVEDPSVASRLESAGEHREVITSFRRASRRPVAYPADLPFVAGVKSHVNEYPDSVRRPRARWEAFGRGTRVFDSVVRQSLAAGWVPDETIPPLLGFGLRAEKLAYFRRGSEIRRVSQHRAGWLSSLVEMEDTPAHFLDYRPTAN